MRGADAVRQMLGRYGGSEQSYRRNEQEYAEKYQELLEKINAFYWDEEKGAYIDSFASGQRRVTRHCQYPLL